MVESSQTDNISNGIDGYMRVSDEYLLFLIQLREKLKDGNFVISSRKINRPRLVRS